MSMNGVNNAGNQDQRSKRRVIYLLWHAIGRGADLAGRSRTLGLVHLDGELRRLLQKARIVWNGPPNNSDHGARNLLTTVIPANPQQFLSENEIMMVGSTANNPDLLHRNLVDFYFTYEPTHDRYEFRFCGTNAARWVPNGAYVFTPVSVPAIHWSSIPGRGKVENPPAPGPTFSNIAGTRLDGFDVMVTTQLTGCAFCWKDIGGLIYAAHISPGLRSDPQNRPPFSNGENLARQLSGAAPANANVGAGDFVNHAGAAIFNVYGTRHGSGAAPAAGYPWGPGANILQNCILGLRIGGVWQLYAQHKLQAGLNVVQII
jgi:hypothetical protein